MNNTEGTFDFVKMETERKMYISAYNVITKLGLWDELRNIDPGNTGYMFSLDPKINNIMNHINNDYGLHSGCSIALTMRVMQHIAKYGYDGYRELYLKG